MIQEVCGRMQPSQRETGSGLVVCCQKPGTTIPAHHLASRPDVLGQTLTRPSRSDLDQFSTIWSMPSSEKQNWIGCRKLDQAYTIRPDSRCLLAVTRTLLAQIWHVYLDIFALQGLYRKILSAVTHFSQTFAIWFRKATWRYATLPHI